jgi:tRNA nucleotidyltransferase (CCA-adding enzyme)
MKTYLVGGAVRDGLLGLPVKDRDWVVVGATPEELVAQGFVPVGRDFPVFLHPHTKEEYALARTERKTAPGYRGFVVHAEPGVTLEEDLARRDLTINAIAQSPDGTLVDPYGGQADLAHQVLRHVTLAFREDPVRILRVARFAARFTQFTVAPETLALMRDMVAHGEASHLVPERVWQELERGLMEAQPSRMLAVLHDCHALPVLLPGFTPSPHTLGTLDIAAQANTPLPVRFACLVLHAPPSLCEHLRVPVECSELAQVVAREAAHIHQALTLDAEGLVQLLERCDALRKPARMGQILQACACDARSPASYPPAQRLQHALHLAQSVITADIAAQAQAAGLSGPAVGQMIHAARVRVVETAGL